MSTTLATLVTEAETKAASVKVALDNLVGWLASVRTDIAKCEADLEQKRRAKDAVIAQLDAQIEDRKRQLADADLKLAQRRKEEERVCKNIKMEKESFLKALEGFGTAA
jgi:hypothetical protein